MSVFYFYFLSEIKDTTTTIHITQILLLHFIAVTFNVFLLKFSFYFAHSCAEIVVLELYHIVRFVFLTNSNLNGSVCI